jgi:DNA-directed RNA polymerase subunit N (RpoN/RPB10)
MTRVKVRCWRVEHWRAGISSPNELFITYPESNSGHSLITCLSCGALYAVDVTKEVYRGPVLAEQAARTSCWRCGRELTDNWAFYPESYVMGGKRHSYQRSSVIPPDSESLVVEFEGLYEPQQPD